MAPVVLWMTEADCIHIPSRSTVALSDQPVPFMMILPAPDVSIALLRYTSRGKNWLIIKGLEVERQQGFHLTLILCVQAVEAIIDCLCERRIVRLGATGQALFLHELPQPLDQIEVRGVAGQEQ